MQRLAIPTATAVGAAAGLAASAPMTAVMLEGEDRLPPDQHEPLEPRQITQELLRRVNLDGAMNDQQLAVASLVAHFGYGAAMGVGYAWLGRRLPLPRGMRGAAYGLAVWAWGYVGWLPALKILPPPLQRPTGRNALLIASHLVWGITTELVTSALPAATSKQAPLRRRTRPS